jgi:phenylacetate-CoA ligase
MFTHFDPALARLTDQVIGDYRSYFAGGLGTQALERQQLQRAARTVAFVRQRSPFYARHLAAAPVIAEDEFSWTDLQRLPFTTKEHLRREQFQMLSRPISEACFFYETTGTTGVATPCPRDYVDCIYNNTPISLCYETILKADDQRHVVALSGPTELHSFGDTLGDVCKNLGLAMVKMWPTSPMVGYPKALEVLSQLRVTALMCTPGMALTLAKAALMQGLDLQKDFCLRVLMLTGELASEAMLQNLQSLWGARAYNFLYGAQETLVMASSTRAGHLHTFPLNFIYEVIDPLTERPVGPSTDLAGGGDVREGELTVTTLFCGAKPLIRYRTGDMVRLRSEVAGTDFPSPTLEVLGRERDIVRINQSRIMAYDLEQLLLQSLRRCLGYQLVIESEGGVDRLQVLLDMAEPGAAAPEICRRVGALLSDRLHSPVTVQVAPVGAIGSTGALVSWKAARIIDKRVTDDPERAFAQKLAERREIRTGSAS